MEDLEVDKIVVTNNVHLGFINSNARLLHALHKIYNKQQLSDLLMKAIEAGVEKGVNLIESYCQYVVLANVTLVNDFEGQIYFLDCRNLDNPTLQDIQFLHVLQWQEKDDIRFKQICTEIKQNPNLTLVRMREAKR